MINNVVMVVVGNLAVVWNLVVGGNLVVGTLVGNCDYPGLAGGL